MTLDTENKRRSAPCHPAVTVYPSPDTGLDALDRIHAAWLYRQEVLTGLPITFGREPTVVVSLTVRGDLAGSQTFYFSPKMGRALSILLGLDVRPYVTGYSGREARIQPDKALTERSRISLQMSDDPNAPAFDPAVFTVYQGGSFWRRLVTAQPDYIGSRVEVRFGFLVAGMGIGDLRLIFKGRLEAIDFTEETSAILTVKDDLGMADMQAPAEISDDNQVNAIAGAGDAAITVYKGSEFTNPQDLPSRDFFPHALRLDPGGTQEEYVIPRSVSGAVVTVQGNYADKSEDLSAAAWTPSGGASVTPDVHPCPFGSDLADKLSLPGTGAKVIQDTADVPDGSDRTFSIWLRLLPSDAAASRTVSLNMVTLPTLNTYGGQIIVYRDRWVRADVGSTPIAGAGLRIEIIRTAVDDAAEVLAFGAQLEHATGPNFYVATDGNAGAAAGRGAFGSTAKTHAVGEEVEEVLAYRTQRSNLGVHPVTVLRDLVNHGLIEAVDVDPASFAQEFDFQPSTLVKRWSLTLIHDSENLGDLIQTLREQAMLDLWIGEDGLVKTRWSFRTNRVGSTVKRLTDEENVIARSSTIENNQDSRITRAIVYYNPKTEDASEDKPAEWNNAQVNVDLAVEDLSGQRSRVIYSRWLTRQAEALALTGRLVSRFRRGARRLALTLDMKDNPDFTTGDVVSFYSQDALSRSGTQAVRGLTFWQVVQKKHERQSGQIFLEGLEFSGRRYGIISPDEDLESPPAPFPDYPAASDAERQYGFIGDAQNKVNAGNEDGYYIL